MSEARYLIKKGAYFYRADKSGYTSFKFDAGRYTKEEAEAEASVEPWHMSAIHEDDVEEDNFVDKEVSQLRRRLALAESSSSALLAKLQKVEKISKGRMKRLNQEIVKRKALERRLMNRQSTLLGSVQSNIK